MRMKYKTKEVKDAKKGHKRKKMTMPDYYTYGTTSTKSSTFDPSDLKRPADRKPGRGRGGPKPPGGSKKRVYGPGKSGSKASSTGKAARRDGIRNAMKRKRTAARRGTASDVSKFVRRTR